MKHPVTAGPNETQSLRGLLRGDDARLLWALWVEALRDLCDCRHARIYAIDEDGWLRVVFPPAPVAAGEGAEPAPADAGDEHRAGQAFSSSSSVRSAADAVCRAVWAPMIDDEGRCVGVIEAALPRQDHGFTDEHSSMLERLGLPLARVWRACQTLDAPDASRILYGAWREVLALRTPFEERANPSVAATRNHEEMQARRYSEEKMAGIARLAAGVAHEVNNPLSVALANLGPWEDIARDWRERTRHALLCLDRGDVAEAQRLLQDELRDAQLEEWDDIAAETRSSLQRIARVVAQLQRFGEQSGYDHESIHLGQEVERAAALFRWGDAGQEPTTATSSAAAATAGSGGNKRRPVDLDVAVKDVTLIWGNRNRIRQILVELLENALRAAAHVPPSSNTEPVRGKVSVEVASDDGKALLRVSDNGPGIDIESQQRIFDPFYTTKSSWRSTGLGLTAVYGMVRAMRGQITIESAPGRGARFSIHFPPVPPEGTDDANPAKQPSSRRSGRYYEDLA